MLKKENKISLLNRLKELGVFWSYQNVEDDIQDDILIEKVLLYLDLDEISILFKLYPKQNIKKVWKDNILSQEPYYHNLNKFISWFYFNEE